MLTLAGLSAFDETVLHRLLTTGDPHTPATLAQSLGAPPEQVRRSVRRLIELRLAVRDGAAVVPVDPRPALTGLVRDRRAILQCLNAGMKDDAIARQLGISERTVRRRVADLAARLGAASRFQIGAQAARRGWV